MEAYRLRRTTFFDVGQSSDTGTQNPRKENRLHVLGGFESEHRRAYEVISYCWGDSGASELARITQYNVSCNEAIESSSSVNGKYTMWLQVRGIDSNIGRTVCGPFGRLQFEEMDCLGDGTSGKVHRALCAGEPFRSDPTDSTVLAHKEYAKTIKGRFIKEWENVEHMKRTWDPSKLFNMLTCLRKTNSLEHLSLFCRLAGYDLAGSLMYDKQSRTTLDVKDRSIELLNLARGLDFLHTDGKTGSGLGKIGYHQDLRPENILVFSESQRNGAFRINDFPLHDLNTEEDPIELRRGNPAKYDIWGLSSLFMKALAWLHGAKDCLMKSTGLAWVWAEKLLLESHGLRHSNVKKAGLATRRSLGAASKFGLLLCASNVPHLVQAQELGCPDAKLEKSLNREFQLQVPNLTILDSNVGLLAAALAVGSMTLHLYSNVRPSDQHKSRVLLVGILGALPVAASTNNSPGRFLLVLVIGAFIAILLSMMIHSLLGHVSPRGHSDIRVDTKSKPTSDDTE